LPKITGESQRAVFTIKLERMLEPHSSAEEDRSGVKAGGRT
jgi:hypothetical protein